MNDIDRCTGCETVKRDCAPLWNQQMKCCPDCTHVPVYLRNIDIIALGEHYSRHVVAMTEEGLHAKSDIAAQLAWRDKQIEELKARGVVHTVLPFSYGSDPLRAIRQVSFARQFAFRILSNLDDSLTDVEQREWLRFESVARQAARDANRSCPLCGDEHARVVDGQCQSCGEPSK